MMDLDLLVGGFDLPFEVQYQWVLLLKWCLNLILEVFLASHSLFISFMVDISSFPCEKHFFNVAWHGEKQFFEVACGVAYSLWKAIFWLLSHVKGMSPTKFLDGNPSWSICVCVFFSWVNFPMVETNKNPLVWRLYLKRKTAKVAIFWKKEVHMLSYLDNEFPLIARTKQDLKKDLLLYGLTSSHSSCGWWLLHLLH